MEGKRGRKPRLFLDETQRKVRGAKRWFWLTYVRRYDLYLGRNLSARRDTRAARDTLAITFQLAPQWKHAELLTDGLWSYGSALGDLGQVAFNEAQIVCHNVFKPSAVLDGQTPYQALGIRLPRAPNDWMRLTRLLTS